MRTSISPLWFVPELEDAEFRLFPCGEHGLRNAHLIIEVLLVEEKREEIISQMDEQFLGRGLAVASGYGDECAGRTFSLEAGEVEKGLVRILHEDDGPRDCSQRFSPVPVAEAAPEGAVIGLGHEQVAVEIGTLERDEELPRFDCPRIGGNGRKRLPLHAMDRPFHGFHDRIKGPHGETPLSPSCR